MVYVASISYLLMTAGMILSASKMNPVVKILILYISYKISLKTLTIGLPSVMMSAASAMSDE